MMSDLERSLMASRKADVYQIYFDFNSDHIRVESAPTLKGIAGILERHSDWKLTINGHTDNIGGDSYNLDLSRRRAASVKQELVQRYHVNAARLSTGGAGSAQPKATNTTLEGRAQNRRVELIRI
jgi:outer membrane protein OmpA-like peptidoglycan-associated protein